MVLIAALSRQRPSRNDGLPNLHSFVTQRIDNIQMSGEDFASVSASGRTRLMPPR